MPTPRIAHLVSGGQTGADRAALDVAVRHDLPYGGWCPRGGWAEDLPEPPGLLAHYPALRETPDADPASRTERNVRDSDATLLLLPALRSPSRGTDRTLAAIRRLERPNLVVDPHDPAATRKVSQFLAQLPGGAVLNVAGPRESEAPGLYAATAALLERVLPLR